VRSFPLSKPFESQLAIWIFRLLGTELTRQARHLLTKQHTKSRLGHFFESMCLISRLTGEVEASTQMDGYRVNQDLGESVWYAGQEFAVVL